MGLSRGRPDPDLVHTSAELADALKALRAGFSYYKLDRLARALPPQRGGPARLPTSTLGDLLNKGRARRETLEVFLAACGTPRDQVPRWLAAWERTRLMSGGPAGAVRVRDAVARRLGVHKPIHVSGAGPDALPTYVLRDVDVDSETGVRARIKTAATGGGFVLLVGESSVGKTRTLYEAVQELLPDWWLLQATPDQLTELAADPPARLVVWLDELQNHLGGERALSGATVRALLHGGAVLLATLWPYYYDLYTAPPSPVGGVDSYHQRDLLKLADTIHVAAALTPDETRRAHAAAEGDTRLRIALQSADFGLTQTIAAAPQLVDRWNNANPYAKAVLTAAIDAARLGARAPVPADMLRVAAPGYCTPVDRARAPANWFEQALAYAAQPLHGATSALIPTTDDAAMATGTGAKAYRIADYLLQHASAQRRSLSPPATFWDACIEHLAQSPDVTRVGRQAYMRMRYCYAQPLLQRAVEAGDPEAAHVLGRLLIGQGESEEAVAVLQAHTKDVLAADTLAELLVALGRDDEAIAVLQVRAAQPIGDMGGRTWPEWKVVEGKNEEAINYLRRQATVRSPRGDVYMGTTPYTEDIDVLRARVDSGDWTSVGQLTELLVEQNEVGEAMELLQIDSRMRGGISTMPHLYAELLTKQGRVDEAITVLRSQLNAGLGRGPDELAEHLAELLLSQGRLDEAGRLARLGLTADGEVGTC